MGYPKQINPTLQEIEEKCKIIQSKWTPQERRNRTVQKVEPFVYFSLLHHPQVPNDGVFMEFIDYLRK